MKLDIQQNLVNLENYFRNILGYNCYWRENNCEDGYFPPNTDSKILVLECSSVMHMLENLENGSKFEHLEEILNKKLAIPEIAYKRFGTHKEAKHFPPCFLVTSFKGKEHEVFTSSGIREIYISRHYAFAGLKNLPMLNYFLYCYDRKDSNFQSIPKKTVEEIENYLKQHNRLIYDCI